MNIIKSEKKALTEEQKDEGAVQYWEQAVGAALRANTLFQDDCAQTAWNEKDADTPFGRLSLVIDMDEALWLDNEYGPEWRRDRDFIKCYQKYRGQSFLNLPSYSSLA